MEISSFVNETMNITCADQPSELKNLRLLDDLQEELHKIKLQLRSSKSVNDELVLEIEKLENQQKTLKNSFEAEKADIVNTWTERLTKLQAILEEERGQSSLEYAMLQKKYDELKGSQGPKSEIPSDYLALKEDLKQNQLEIDELKKQLLASKETIRDVECKNLELHDRERLLEKELEECKEAMKFKNESLQSTLKALEEIKDEKALLSSELAILKAGPIENKGRGNSLFSEVDDKRQNLEKMFAVLHRKYLEAKRSLAMSASELEKVKRENIKFQLLWEEGESKLQSSERKLFASYKAQIKELLHRINELELRPESPKIVTISDKDLSNMEWIHTIVDQARAEVREIRSALGTKSMEKLFAEEDMHSLTSEVTHLRRQNMKDQAVIEDLKMRISLLEKSATSSSKDLQVDESSSNPGKENKNPNSNGKTLRFAEGVKENDGVPLKKESRKKEVLLS